MKYNIHPKVNWHISVSSNWQEAFYPSLVKKLLKSESWFEENLNFQVTPLNKIEEAEQFFKVYDKEIASRKNYVYLKDEQKLAYKKRLDIRRYYQAVITKKNTYEYVGGMIFSIFDNKISFGLRSFDKELRKEFKRETTVDYWAEKKIYELANSKKLAVISHGTETYPNKGRLGLVLFKLKIGGKPKLSKKEYDMLDIETEEINESDTSTFFWTNPDADGYFQECQLFFKDEHVDESVLSELVKVTEWTGVLLKIHKL